jgi:hypothetical protein
LARGNLLSLDFGKWAADWVNPSYPKGKYLFCIEY